MILEKSDIKKFVTKPKNIEQLYYEILKIVSELYDKYVPQNVKKRRNKEKAKMSDAEIVSI